MLPVASLVLGVYTEKIVNTENLSSVNIEASSCSVLCWCVRGVSYGVGIAVIENTTVTYVHQGFGTVSFDPSNKKATIFFDVPLGNGTYLKYVIIPFTE